MITENPFGFKVLQPSTFCELIIDSQSKNSIHETLLLIDHSKGSNSVDQIQTYCLISSLFKIEPIHNIPNYKKSNI